MPRCGTRSMAEIHTSFQSINKGIDWTLLPARLYEKGKRLGTWNPHEIDYSQDVKDWNAITEAERNAMLQLVSLFGAGEEAVTLDLLPLVKTMAEEGRLEEEMYLTDFLFEESKHTEAFRRFLDAIGCHEDLSQYHTPSYKKIFYEELPGAMHRLLTDPSPAAQAEASVTYNMIVEGVLAETGYYGFRKALEPRGLAPGFRRTIQLIATDESRHIAYGVYLLSRLVAVDDSIFQVIQNRMSYLMQYAAGVISELTASYGENPPFAFDPNDFMQYGIRKFQGRMAVIERARGKKIEELYRLPAEEYEPEVAEMEQAAT